MIPGLTMLAARKPEPPAPGTIEITDVETFNVGGQNLNLSSLNLGPPAADRVTLIGLTCERSATAFSAGFNSLGMEARRLRHRASSARHCVLFELFTGAGTPLADLEIASGNLNIVLFGAGDCDAIVFIGRIVGSRYLHGVRTFIDSGASISPNPAGRVPVDGVAAGLAMGSATGTFVTGLLDAGAVLLPGQSGNGGQDDAAGTHSGAMAVGQAPGANSDIRLVANHSPPASENFVAIAATYGPAPRRLQDCFAHLGLLGDDHLVVDAGDSACAFVDAGADNSVGTAHIKDSVSMPPSQQPGVGLNVINTYYFDHEGSGNPWIGSGLGWLTNAEYWAFNGSRHFEFADDLEELHEDGHFFTDDLHKINGKFGFAGVFQLGASANQGLCGNLGSSDSGHGIAVWVNSAGALVVTVGRGAGGAALSWNTGLAVSNSVPHVIAVSVDGENSLVNARVDAEQASAALGYNAPSANAPSARFSFGSRGGTANRLSNNSRMYCASIRGGAYFTPLQNNQLRDLIRPRFGI